jgi:NhaP-type Na+/H+ and K+/H+ antiporter
MVIQKNSKSMTDGNSSNSLFILIIVAIVVIGALLLYALNNLPGVVTGDSQSPGVCKSGPDCPPQVTQEQVTQEFSKENLTASQKKISTDLLQLIGVISLPSGMSRDDFEQQMKQARQIKWVDATGVITNETKTGRKVVNVYIKTITSSPTNLVNPYIWNISNADQANALIVAWVEPDNLLKLASLDDVQSIRTVLPPVNN